MSLSAFIVSPSPFTLFLAGFILIALEVEVCMSQNTSYCEYSTLYLAPLATAACS